MILALLGLSLSECLLLFSLKKARSYETFQQDAIAQILDLPLEVVQQVATQQNTSKQNPSSN